MIRGNSWRLGCPVGPKELRYIQVKHYNFKGTTTIGEIVIHKDISNQTVKIFKELYNIKYPIKQMRLVSDFGGSDWQSIEADNTSALNCRKVTSSKTKWSKHAYGKAIDINPIENPYISRSGKISHKKSQRYRTREPNRHKALLYKDSKAVKIFKKYGWRWGGDWNSIKDYQHFSR